MVTTVRMATTPSKRIDGRGPANSERRCTKITAESNLMRTRARRTFCVAIVGADGSGKTSVAHRILQHSALPVRYVYMGPAIGSSNYALPTSRLINYMKRRALKDMISASQSLPPQELITDDMKKRLPTRGSIIKTLGLINRIAEEWYRQLIVQLLRLRGFIVLCDRHFLFEYCPDSPIHQERNSILSVRIHRWLLSRCYPRPHLVIHLYAPPEILHERTPEWTLDYLASQQARIRAQGRHVPTFVEIDARRPLEEVTAHVERLIGHFRERGSLPAD